MAPLPLVVKALKTPILSTSSCEQTGSDTKSASHTLFQSVCNKFGLWRRYTRVDPPSYDPEENVTLADLCSMPLNTPTVSVLDKVAMFPFPNRSSFMLGNWYWNEGAQKSQDNFQKLIKIIGNPDFSPLEIQKANWKGINDTLGGHTNSQFEWEDIDSGWHKSQVTIDVPFHRFTTRPGVREYTVTDFYHCSLMSVIREKLSSPSHHTTFHHDPYELWWTSPSGHNSRVYGELYASKLFLEEHQKIQKLLLNETCCLPRTIAALMFWSDSTQLTSFGNAQLWPLYLFFGNESKYRRCKPTLNLCEHIAYFQKLPDAFKDFTGHYTGNKKPPNDSFMAHYNEFTEAFQVFPRIFTYSADYPEKVLVANIKNWGICPCPRCLTPSTHLCRIGTIQDRKDRKLLMRSNTEHESHGSIKEAREQIYKQSFSVDSASVKRLMMKHSLVPTSNAFFEKLYKHGFDIHSSLVVDFMHEVELGVWKSLFTHLLHILQAVDINLISELDRHYRTIPSFGRDSIRRFSANTSEMKKLAAQDFENLLQCAIPVFDGLFPELHNGRVMNLLFTMAHWHGMAKLRLHTDATLNILDELTTSLGHQLCEFSEKTCSAYKTEELPKETRARQGCEAKLQNPWSQTGHSLGDYVEAIRAFGSTDSYSTETGELEHRTPKARYRRTSRKMYISQMTRIERRQMRIRRIRDSLHRLQREATDDSITWQAPEVHHHIGKSQNSAENIGAFLRANWDKEFSKDFLLRLKDHLLPRIKVALTKEAAAENDLEDHYLGNDLLYKHKIMHINYTSYDVLREQDVIHPSTAHSNVMLLNTEDSKADSVSPHYFRYAHVLGIYHANIIYTGHGMRGYHPRRLEFLWVQWYQHVDLTQKDWSCGKLDRVELMPEDAKGSFGFLDPSNIIRGCHLISLLGQKRPQDHLKRHLHGRTYYVNRFADRDMVMRFHWGLAMGHDPNDPNIVLSTVDIPTPILGTLNLRYSSKWQHYTITTQESFGETESSDEGDIYDSDSSRTSHSRSDSGTNDPESDWEAEDGFILDYFERHGTLPPREED
ncbi:hypothetical protein BDQ12DRAFT_700523 [Crucibulum laeve]|uniref:Uncharacterized protein n=1 Tax=Crucibulum laeve TaxID=68775 RepID=A0A5C3LZ89_9AGAR|nr:hypothetical protein BDQ12DRAFT_700523 [Crucibulum laeve]